MVILYNTFREKNIDQTFKDILRTAVDLSHLLYSRDYNRTPKTALALHNTSFIHGMLCINAFSRTGNTKSFGRYFHSLTTHSAILYHIVSLFSLNTEDEDRMFGQAKSITKSTSNNHPNYVIENIIQRVQIEGECEYKEQNKIEESDIHKLSAAFGRRKNTIFSTTFMDEQALQYQAHLERIGDFLLPGEGVW